MTCSEDPKAHHGFDRNASHNEGRYVCECESAAQEPLGDSEGAATPVAADLVIRLRIPGDEVFSSRMKSQIADRIEALEKERGMWKETDLRDAKRVDELAEQLGTLNEALTITSQGNANMKKQLAAVTKERDELVATMEHLLEYWNGDNNETAMHDALTHFDDVIRAALAKLGAEMKDHVRAVVSDLAECQRERDELVISTITHCEWYEKCNQVIYLSETLNEIADYPELDALEMKRIARYTLAKLGADKTGEK